MITEQMAEALVGAAFDALGDLVERGVKARRASACYRKEKWRALIELTNADRQLRGKSPRWQAIRRAKLRWASAQCKAGSVTCAAIRDAVDRRIASEKDRMAKQRDLISASA